MVWESAFGHRQKRPICRSLDDLTFSIERDWRDLNPRPTASDLCEFPHSLDYTFTLSKSACRW